MNRIFISYSRTDRDAVHKLVRLIERESGEKCWIDLTGIDSGSQFEETIIKAIDAADVVLLMMSDQSVQSPWIKREVYYAEGEGKRIVPISMDRKPLRGWVKFHFGHVDCIDAASPEQVDKLMSNLKSWLNEERETDSDSGSVRPQRRKRRWVIPAAVLLALLSFAGVALWLAPESKKTKSAAGEMDEEAVPSPFKGSSDTHEWVDLGTGVKWATCNVGAALPGDYGSHFAWGETVTKKDYTWENYRFRVSGNSPRSIHFSKYNTVDEKGTPDRKTRLDKADDVAHAAWGGDWRTPTREEFEALLAACTVSWTSRNGHDGCLFTSRTTGGQVFLPASGYSMADSLSHVGFYGHYWSSSLNEERSEIAWYLFLDESGARMGDRYRFAGRAIRPVRP